MKWERSSTVFDWPAAVPPWAWYAVIGGAALVTLGVAAYRRAVATDGRTPAAALFYLGALVSLVVSADTSWRFFDTVLGISNLYERAIMFGALEIVLIACAVAMRAHTKTSPDGKPGSAQGLALLLLAFSAYAAFAMSPTLAAGLARVAWGPLLGLFALHQALGIEVRYSEALKPRGLFARVLLELRERLLSLLGLGDDERTAVTIRRDRAARRLARLSTGGKPHFPMLRRWRMRRAATTSNVAHDQNARSVLLDELAILRHLDALSLLMPPSPWGPGKPAAAVVRPKALATVTSITATRPDWHSEDMKLSDAVARFLDDKPDATTDEIHAALGGIRNSVSKTVARVRERREA